MSNTNVAKIAFKLEPDALTKFEVETLWATPLGAELYRIESTPFYVNGVAQGDVVSIDLEIVKLSRCCVPRRSADELCFPGLRTDARLKPAGLGCWR